MFVIGLSEAIRIEVMLTSVLETIWQKADFIYPDLVAWRWVCYVFKCLRDVGFCALLGFPFTFRISIDEDK